jgi:excisionase family DNA binding protein
MTTNEAAKVLGLSRSRVIALINAGNLHAVKIGRDWWITQEDIDNVQIETKHRRKNRLISETPNS